MNLIISKESPNMSKLILTVIVTAILLKSCCSLKLLDDYTANVRDFLEDVVSKYDEKLLDINNGDCVEQIRLFLRNLLYPFGDDIWALKMIDASGKKPAGLLELNMGWIGRYEECLNIRSHLTNVKGKYCLATISVDTNAILGSNNVLGFEKPAGDLKTFYNTLKSNSDKSGIIQVAFLPSYGICIPDKCTDNDFQSIVASIIPLIPWNVTCQTKESIKAPLDTGAILTLSYFGIFISAMFLSTIYDVCRRSNDEPHPLLVAFSVYSNWKKLFRVSKHTGEFSSLHGMRFLSMLWVIYGHTFFVTIYGPLTNLLDVFRFIGKRESLLIGNATLSVDTFFTITGMLVVYSFMKAMHGGHKFNIFKFYLHRYIRLTPPLIPVILASIYLTKHLGSGPFYPQMDATLADPCRKNWWATILHIQNYVSNTNQNLCVAQTWYLDIDWQIYLLAPVFLLFLPKYPLVGLGIMLLGTTGSLIFTYLITIEKQLISIETNIHGNLIDYNKYYYFKTHTRVSTWFIGGFLGYILAKMKFEKNVVQLNLSRYFLSVCWIIVLIAIPACIFGGFDTLVTQEYHPHANACFNTFARPAWALCICWMVFACFIGHGGIINRILSWPVFQVLNRFTFSIYLIHLTMLYILSASQKQLGYYSTFNVVSLAVVAFALSFVISIFWVLAFESPVVVLERYFLGAPRKKIQLETTQNIKEEP